MYRGPISYSGKSLFFECPARWADAYIHGNRGPQGKAAERGNQLHDALEQFFLEPTGLYPREVVTNRGREYVLAGWEDFMRRLLPYSPIPECELAVDENWRPTQFNDPLAYARGKADLRYTDDTFLYIYDWKSGRMYDSHVKQGEMYVAMSPEGHEQYVARFVYLDQAPTTMEWRYTPADRRTIIIKLIDEIETIRNAHEYPETPNANCKWCHLSWRNGGGCTKAP